MKAWDEDWCDDTGNIELVGTEAPYGPVVVRRVGQFWVEAADAYEGVARGKLAAAAPAMARALRDAEVALEGWIQHCEGAPSPSELSTKDVHAKVLDALKKAGLC